MIEVWLKDVAGSFYVDVVENVAGPEHDVGCGHVYRRQKKKCG